MISLFKSIRKKRPTQYLWVYNFIDGLQMDGNEMDQILEHLSGIKKKKKKVK